MKETLLDVIPGLIDRGFLRWAAELGPGAYIGEEGPHGWGAVARAAAHELPGQHWAGRQGGCAWKCGGGPLTGCIVDARAWPKIQEGRDAVRSLLPEAESGPLPYSNGACARSLLRWVGDKQKAEKSAEALLQGNPSDPEDRRVQYHDCRPGLYRRAMMFDCSGYYYQLLRRLPSLRVTVLPSRLLWHKMGAEERDRWRDVLEAVEGCKPLRNALWGASLGSYARRTAYTRDRKTGRVKIIKPVFGPGPFRPMAIVLARSAWELCREASIEVGSVYSTVDSVTSIDGTRPRAWARVGLPFGPKHEGESDFVAEGCWKIGGYETEPYRWQQQSLMPRIPVAIPPPLAPHNVIYSQWL